MNVMRGSLQRNKRIQFRGREGEKNGGHFLRSSAEVTPRPRYCRPYDRPSVRTGHTHTCERAARRAVCAIRCLPCIRRAARLIDKMQGEGSCMWSITCTSPATCTRLCTGTRGHMRWQIHGPLFNQRFDFVFVCLCVLD